MAVYENDWFHSDRVMKDEGARIWQQEVFKRAYCQRDGPFTRVCGRLRSDFSVLVYLSGNCMSAAADHVKGVVQSGNWKDYGEHPGKGSLAEALAIGSVFPSVVVTGDRTPRVWHGCMR